MKEIHQYEELYEKLKNGEHVTPVSREEALMMALIDRLGSSSSDDNSEEVD